MDKRRSQKIYNNRLLKYAYPTIRIPESLFHTLETDRTRVEIRFHTPWLQQFQLYQYFLDKLVKKGKDFVKIVSHKFQWFQLKKNINGTPLLKKSSSYFLCLYGNSITNMVFRAEFEKKPFWNQNPAKNGLKVFEERVIQHSACPNKSVTIVELFEDVKNKATFFKNSGKQNICNNKNLSILRLMQNLHHFWGFWACFHQP